MTPSGGLSWPHAPSLLCAPSPGTWGRAHPCRAPSPTLGPACAPGGRDLCHLPTRGVALVVVTSRLWPHGPQHSRLNHPSPGQRPRAHDSHRTSRLDCSAQTAGDQERASGRTTCSDVTASASGAPCPQRPEPAHLRRAPPSLCVSPLCPAPCGPSGDHHGQCRSERPAHLPPCQDTVVFPTLTGAGGISGPLGLPHSPWQS